MCQTSVIDVLESKLPPLIFGRALLCPFVFSQARFKCVSDILATVRIDSGSVRSADTSTFVQPEYI